MGEYHPRTVEYVLRKDPEYRKSMGQFFTPKGLRERLLSHLPRLSKPKVLDPACGTGEFLLSAREYFIDPELHCWEIDGELAEIARTVVSEARVEVVDSLRKPFVEEFDVVLGNPPYYEFKPDEELREKYREIIYGRTNIYALFIYLGLKLLKPGGYLAYIVSSSMNNGAYFRKLREFIVRTADIEYMEVIEDPHIFEEANHTFQLLVLRKGVNSGRYIFRRGPATIFSENAEELRKAFEDAYSLKELGYRVRTGKVVWNENRDKLTNDPSKGVPLIWSHNIVEGRIVLGNKPGKPQYIMWDQPDVGPAIVVTRVVGHPKSATLEAALIPPGFKFVAENHVNVVYPPKNASVEEMEDIVRQINSPETRRVVSLVTGNTQISARELEWLVPVKLRNPLRTPAELRGGSC